MLGKLIFEVLQLICLAFSKIINLGIREILKGGENRQKSFIIHV